MLDCPNSLFLNPLARKKHRSPSPPLPVLTSTPRTFGAEKPGTRAPAPERTHPQENDYNYLTNHTHQASVLVPRPTEGPGREEGAECASVFWEKVSPAEEGEREENAFAYLSQEKWQ